MCKKYSKEEIEFIKNNYISHGAKYCAKKLGRNPLAVAQIARQNNLVRQKPYTEDEIDFIKNNYPLHGAGYCAEKLNRTPRAIVGIARRNKISRDSDALYRRVPTPDGYIYCYGCEQVLPESFFYKKKSDGTYGKKSNMCRTCCQKKARHHYDKYKWNNTREKNPLHFIFIRLKSSAKKRGIEFLLTEDDLREKWNTHCPVFKKELIFFSNSDWSPSVDRIDSNIGYTKENIVVVSRKANMQKNNSTVEELKLLYEFYSQITQRKKPGQ